MAILTVGPTSTFPTIAAAMAAAGTGDILSLEAGYGNENATVTVDGLSFDGGPSSTDINLQLATGVGAITLLGTAPINVLDGPDANSIVGNDGDNIITVSSGVDVVNAGNGTDRLIVDYGAATAPITGTLVNVTDGGTHAVTFTGVENFTISTGSGNDTLTVADGFNVLSTGAGNDTITAGNGHNLIDGGIGNDTITAGNGANTIDGGAGNDTIVAGNGGNTINGGDGDDGITTGSGNDVVNAGLGNDTVITGAGNDVTTVNGGIDTVDSGSGTDRLIIDYSSSTTNVNGGVTGGTLAGGYDGAFADVAGTSSVVFQATENFTVTTGIGNDVIATGDGADVLDGGAGSDQLNAGGGDDTLLIGLGSDALDGGAGTDTALFDGARADYQITDLGGGVIQSIDLRPGSPDGTDTLVNIEGFTFTDGTFDATTVLNDPPTLGGDLGISVPNGGTVAVTTADLTATDSDNTNAQLVYTVTGTLHGTVLVGGSAAASFTEADLVANAVSFQHDGSATNGSFTVSLTDGTATPQMATVLAAVDLPGNNPPVLGGDLGIAVPNGGTAVVTTVDLTATDSDNTNAQLVYTVTGTLHGTVLVGGIAAGSFTEADLVANAVSFQHDGSATNGSFTVSLTDGTAAPQMATVLAAVDLPGNNAPVLGGDLGIAVPNGGTVIVTAVDLTATDSDNTNAQLVYTVTGALHGTVLVGGSAAASFTEADILANAVSFQHDGSATNGSFTVSLTDGTAAPQMATVIAAVDLPGNNAPVLGGDLGIAVANGGTVIVTPVDLTATDSDNTNAQLVYTVTGTLHGAVLLDGVAATSFTEADILANAVSFHHDGGATDGSFTVSLTDGTAAPQMATVLAAVDLPGNNAPVLGGDLGIAVANGGTVIVTPVDLTATDSDNTNAQLVYTVTGAVHGAVLLDGSAATSFTEADILANAVSFHHDGSATDGSFTVSLTDGIAAPQMATVLAAVDLPGNNAPVLGGDLGIAVPNGGTVVVTTVDLTATDSDNTNAQLVYTVTGAVHGAVLLDGSAATSFTEADLAANAVSFHHDGSATDGSFTVSLTDGTAAPQTATVDATVGDSPPTDITLSNATIGEYSADGTVVGTFTTADPDSGDSFSYALLDNAGDRFAINGSDLVVKNYILLDYEQHSSHSVAVEVTDSAGMTFDKDFTIGVNDINPETVGGPATDDTIVGGALVDNINGGGGNDLVIGGAGGDWLGGGAGDDQVIGGDGADALWGEDGNDQISGGPGDDVILGGAGNDILGGDDGNDAINAGDGNDTIFGGTGDDQLGGGAGDDTIVGGDGNDAIWGEDGNDIINAGPGNDIVLGGAGNDQIGGGTGNDDLRGEAGNDVIWGEDGDDIITGGTGDDTLIGGAGHDTFVFAPGDGHDTITDFTATGPDSDHIWLAGTDLHNFADVVSHESFNPATGATTISYNGTNTITINNQTQAQLTVDHFIFG